MPLYEYQCPKCGHRFERIQKFSDPDPKKCPECGAGKLERLLHAPAVQFKGSGWYVTDYGKAASSSKSSESKSSESSASKSEDKPKSDSAKSSSEKKREKG